MNPRGGAHYVESGAPGKGYFQPQLKSILHVKLASSGPSAHGLWIFTIKGNRIAVEFGCLREYQGMALRLAQFLAIMLTALRSCRAGRISLRC